MLTVIWTLENLPCHFPMAQSWDFQAKGKNFVVKLEMKNWGKIHHFSKKIDAWSSHYWNWNHGALWYDHTKFSGEVVRILFFHFSTLLTIFQLDKYEQRKMVEPLFENNHRTHNADKILRKNISSVYCSMEPLKEQINGSRQYNNQQN